MTGQRMDGPLAMDDLAGEFIDAAGPAAARHDPDERPADGDIPPRRIVQALFPESSPCDYMTEW